MDEQGTALAQAGILNESLPDLEGFRARIGERCRDHAQEVDHLLRTPCERLQTQEEREIKARLRSALLDGLGIRDDYEQLRVMGRQRRFFSGETSGVMVWWGSTHWWYPTPDATVWMDGDGVHIAAKFEIDDGDLRKYSIRVVAEYFIGSDRLPARGRTYLSNPAFEVSGEATGYALGGIWDFGDQWSKCWLNTTQRVFMVSPQAAEPPKPNEIVLFMGLELASKSNSRRLIFVENSVPEQVQLPGWLGMPVFFNLPEEAEALQFELEWQFDIQLEGESFLSLGHTDKAPVCTIRHPQWMVVEL